MAFLRLEHGKAIAAPKSKPKPKPQFKPKQEAPIQKHFRLVAESENRARARRADSRTPDIHTIGLTPPGRPTRYYGTSRPAPAYSVRNVSAAQLETDPGKDAAHSTSGVVSVNNFLAKMRASAAAHGDTEKFDKQLTKNRGFKAMNNDPEHGSSNVAIASAFGLPVDTSAADKFSRDVVDAMKSGVDPHDVPKLV